MKRIFFVRHAKALDRELWRHPDEQRPLTDTGYRQAKTLAGWLRRARVDRVISSRAYRCSDTVVLLAEMRGLRVVPHDALFEGSSAERALTLMRRTPARSLVLCTHGDVMQDVLERLDDDGVELEGGMKLAKGAYWTFEMNGSGEIETARYHSAPR